MSELIIGGGIGGLFTGALLAKEGHQVTVLEKNVIVGGGLQTFTRHGVSFDTGMHMLGGLRKGESIYRICQYLGITDRLSVRNNDADCMDQITYMDEQKTYRVPEGREAFTAYFQREFPHEAENIRHYVDALYQLAGEVDFFYLRPDTRGLFMHSEQFLQPADAFIAHYIGDERLRDILAYMNPMYAGRAGHTPAYIHALLNVLYINGPSRFVGSSQQMADALCDVIRQAGGQVVSHAPVVSLEVEDKLVTAVVTADGRRWTADNYVAAIHPATLLRMTDSKVFTRAFRERISTASNTYSSFCAYIVFKPESFPYINHTCYYQERHGLAWHFADYDADTWPRGFMYMTPCEPEQGEWAQKMIINAIMPYSACCQWTDTQTGRRGPDYEAWKQAHLEKMLDKMEALYPGFRQTVAAAYTSSPLTIRDFYNEPEGALYGLQKDCQNMAASQLPVVTKLRNLYMTGQNVNLHGCCGVPLTAINTAEAIVGSGTILNKINK